jgi:predicted O-methyltransferase YrrM
MRNSYFRDAIRKAHSMTSIVDFYVNSQSDAVGNTPEDIMEFSYRHYPISPRQVRSELLRFARLVCKWRPKIIVEIGTHAGGTFFVLSRCADSGATVVSIDLPGAPFSGGYPKFSRRVLPRMPLSTQKLQCLRANSHDGASVEWLKGVLLGRSVDVIFIDGDHTYEGVKQDFELYASFVRPGGLVAFHDIVKHKDASCQVDAFWNEVKGQHTFEEIVEDPSQGWAGIGVLYF